MWDQVEQRYDNKDGESDPIEKAECQQSTEDGGGHLRGAILRIVSTKA